MPVSLHRILILFSLTLTSIYCSNLRTQWDPSLQKLAVSQSQDDVGIGILWFILGPIMFVLSFVVIWYNQKRAAINTKRLLKIQEILNNNHNIRQNANISVQNMNQNKLVNNYDPNKLIHVTGNVNVITPAQDILSKLVVQKSIKIQRYVQVRQYRSVGKKNDPPELGWYSHHIGQVNGKTNDNANWFIKSEIFTSKEAKINSYTLNQTQMKSQMTNFKVIPTTDMALAIVQSVNRPNASYLVQSQYIYFPAVDDDKISHGTLRVRYTAYKPDVLSIIATYNQNMVLQPYRIDLYVNKGSADDLCCQGKSCCCACNALGQLLKPVSEVDFVMQGTKTKDQMIQTQLATNKGITNVIRISSYLFMVLGIFSFFSPLVNILGYIPLVGGFIKSATTAFVFLAAIIVCIPLFLVTFALAWLVYHPKIGILAIIFAALVITIIVVLDQVYKDK